MSKIENSRTSLKLCRNDSNTTKIKFWGFFLDSILFLHVLLHHMRSNIHCIKANLFPSWFVTIPLLISIKLIELVSKSCYCIF